MTATPRMMSRSQKVRLATRSKSSSPRRARTPVSQALSSSMEDACSHLLDVIVLTAMGEECAIDAKEAPIKG
jgi:hypothetical protein